MSISNDVDGDFLTHTGQSDTIEAAERRKFTPRNVVSISMLAIVLGPSNAPQFDILCIDISKNGMAFLSPIAFAPNDMIVAKMPIRNGVGRMLLCRIRHCQPHHDKPYVAGVEFLDAVSLTPNCTIPTRWFHF